MICYKDMTFCTAWGLCKKGCTCERALTSEVGADAVAWWGEDNAPIAVYDGLPDCFVPFFEETK